MRAFVNKRTGRAIVTSDNAKTKPWADSIRHCAMMAWDGAPIDAPIEIALEFMLPRPKAHYRRNGRLRDGVRKYHASKPDIDKLARNALDAITRAGIWVDDSRVALLNCTKRYAATVDECGLRVEIKRMEVV
jgi:Holliday junction resolvase RusA-like endonuclease